MIQHQIFGRRGLKASLLAGAAVCGFASLAAVAQPALQTQQSQQSASAQTEVLQEIVVTGSRIRRSALEVLQPTVETSLEYIDRRGFTNIADALNDQPGFGSGVNPVGDQSTFNVGQNFVNLFSLGSARTLTLINGRRVVAGRAPSLFGDAAPGLQVDLNIIPTAFIDRIDRIAVGGAPIYGADAVAGTVNVILRDQFDGAEADLQYGVSSQSDLRNYRARAAVGQNFFDDRANIAFAVEYNDTGGLINTDRPRTALDLTFVPNPLDRTGTDGIPGQLYATGRTIPIVTAGGVPLTANSAGGTPAQISSRFFTIADPSNPSQQVPAQFVGGRLVPFNPGQIFNGSVALGGEGLRLSSVTSLQAPVERKLAATMGHVDLLENVTWFFEGNYALTKGYENANQPVYNTPLFPAPGSGVSLSTTNPFLSAADQAILSAGGRTSFFLSRGSLDLVDGNKNSSRNEMYRGVTGFRGDVDVFDRDVNWDIAYNYGETKGRFTSTQLLTAEFNNAVDAIRDPATNTIVCRSRAPGCAPLNLFGNGSPSAQAIDYVSDLDTSRSSIKQESFEANLESKVLPLPGGDLRLAMGASWREETGQFEPGPVIRAGRSRSAQTQPVSGSFTSREIYGEVLVPILSADMNIPLVHRLEVEAAGRRVLNSLTGGANIWTIGGRYAPAEDLMFRGNRTVSIRSPALTELFLPTSNIFTTGVDPCATRNITGGPNPTARQANCRSALQALGRNPDAPFVSRVETATIQGVTSGNPDLKNETANGWTVGVVLTPTFAPGFTASVDWVDIEIKNAISNFGTAQLLQVCYDSPSFPNAACNRFRRTSSADNPAVADDIGQVTFVQAGYVNAGYQNFSGLTATASYEFDLDAYGKLELGGTYYYINELETSVTGLGFDLNKNVGEIGDSKDQIVLSIDYDYEDFSMLLQANYLSEAKFNVDFTNESRDFLQVDSYWRFDATVSYAITEDVVARLAVNNLLDEEPPAYTTGVVVYDLVGRYFSFGVNAKF